PRTSATCALSLHAALPISRDGSAAVSVYLWRRSCPADSSVRRTRRVRGVSRLLSGFLLGLVVGLPGGADVTQPHGGDDGGDGSDDRGCDPCGVESAGECLFGRSRQCLADVARQLSGGGDGPIDAGL